MEHSLTEYSGTERENNQFLAEYQAYIIDELITEFDALLTWWLVDCGYDENTVRIHRWSEVGAFELHLYPPELVKFARQVAWSRI